MRDALWVGVSWKRWRHEKTEYG